MTGRTILSVENLNITFKQKSGEKCIVRDGKFEVKSGEFVLLLGENGSGKSSILRSLIREDAVGFNNRKLTFKGEEVDSTDKLDIFRRSIGYARQEDDSDIFFSRKVWDFVYDYAQHAVQFEGLNKRHIQSEMQRVYDGLKCDKYADGNFKNSRLKTCSGGEKRMAAIFAALSRTKSDLFILDEPINNLDAYHARLLNNYLVMLREQPNPPGILVITHCHMFQKVDRVYKLADGELIEIFDYSPKSCYGNCTKNGLYVEE